MKTILILTFLAATMLTVFAAEKDARCFEMRTYYAAEGKLDELNARFRDHTCKLFEKHGMENIGYWMPTENPDRKLIYILGYPSREAREKSWKAFMADPDWKAAAKASEANGKLVSKVESAFLSATDYSPAIKPAKAAAARTFEHLHRQRGQPRRARLTFPRSHREAFQQARDGTRRLLASHGWSEGCR
jgi:hypothetical protein